MSVTREEFAIKLLQEINAPVTQRNLYALVSWMHAEGSKATYNPLATTQEWAGATNFNSVGVKNYPSLDVGVAATAKTLNYGADRHLYGYDKIRFRLRQDERPRRTLAAVESSSWGTGGLAKRVLKYAKANWSSYRAMPITGL